jgi:hypothetical protein
VVSAKCDSEPSDVISATVVPAESCCSDSTALSLQYAKRLCKIQRTTQRPDPTIKWSTGTVAQLPACAVPCSWVRGYYARISAMRKNRRILPRWRADRAVRRQHVRNYVCDHRRALRWQYPLYPSYHDLSILYSLVRALASLSPRRLR